MRKPLNARSTQFVKIQTSARATLGANPASSASRQPIRRPSPSGPRCEPLEGAYLDAAIDRRALTEMAGGQDHHRAASEQDRQGREALRHHPHHPYEDPRQEAARLKTVHGARVKIVPRV